MAGSMRRRSLPPLRLPPLPSTYRRTTRAGRLASRARSPARPAPSFRARPPPPPPPRARRARPAATAAARRRALRCCRPARRRAASSMVLLIAIRWCAALQRSAVVAIGCTLCSGCNRLYALQPHLLLPPRCSKVARRCAAAAARGRQLDALARLDRCERHQLHCAEQVSLTRRRAASRHSRFRRRISRTSFRARCIVPGLRPLGARRAAPATTTLDAPAQMPSASRAS